MRWRFRPVAGQRNHLLHPHHRPPRRRQRQLRRDPRANRRASPSIAPSPAVSEPPVVTAWRKLEPGDGPDSREDHTWTLDPSTRTGVPVRRPRRRHGVRRPLGIRPRVRHLARARPGRQGTCGALRPRGRLGGRRRPRRVGRPGWSDGLLRRPLGVRPRRKRLVATPERRAEARRALWLVFGDRDRRAAMDQPRLHVGGGPLLRYARVRLRRRADGPTRPPTATSPWCAACTRAG